MLKKKVCWKITTACNQGCKYCFGFNNIPNLPFEDNQLVLEHLIASGINHITWTGGEAVLYPRVNELMKESKNRGLHNKLVTNGIYLSKNDNEYVEDILNTLDEINLSIDSIENDINLSLGKENNHLEIIKKLLDKTKDRDIKVRINTVVSKLNVNKLEKLGEFLNNYKIEKWKFLKFMPVREKAMENEKLFEVSEAELEQSVHSLKTFENIEKVEYKKQSEFEKSIVILPNADIVQTQNGKDHYFGNILSQEVFNFNKIYFPNKIRTFIAHNNLGIQQTIIDSIKKLPYVEIIGTATDGIDTYNKIVELEPELVFSKYNFDNMSGLELVSKTKEKLQERFPVFNTIGEIPDNELMQILNITGNKLNADVTEPYAESASEIIKAYKEYKY